MTRKNGQERACVKCDSDGNCYHSKNIHAAGDGNTGGGTPTDPVYGDECAKRHARGLECALVASVQPVTSTTTAGNDSLEDQVTNASKEVEAAKKDLQDKYSRAALGGNVTHAELTDAEQRYKDAQATLTTLEQKLNEQKQAENGHKNPDPAPEWTPVDNYSDKDGPERFVRTLSDYGSCLWSGGCPWFETPAGERLPSTVPGVSHRNGTPGAKDGDPVAVGSGQLVDSAVDLELPARGGLHFKLERFYSSGGISQGALGRNWRHSYEEKIIPVTEFTPGIEDMPSHCVDALPVVHCIVHETATSRVIYTQDPKTLAFLPPPGNYSAIIREDGGAWVLREADGTVTGFDKKGRIRTKRDPNGNLLDFYYGPTGESPLLAVVDPLQRIIRFSYERDRLKTVSDFVGRTVTYGYETKDTTVTIDPLAAREFGVPQKIPGAFHEQAFLTSVTHYAPATPSRGPRTATWQYEYLSDFQVYEKIDERPIVDPPTKEMCSAAGNQYRALLAWVLMRDHLLGNLTKVTDPNGQVVLVSTYQTDPFSLGFDRVIEQQYGASAETQGGPKATYKYFSRANVDSVPAQVRDGLRLGVEGCDAPWRRHAGRPVIPPEPVSIYPNIGRISTSPIGRPVFNLRGMVVTFQPPPQVPTAAPVKVDTAKLSEDVNTVCQWTQFTDRLGIATWYGTNFMGQALVAARQGDSASQWFRTVIRYNFHGEIASVLSPGGHLDELTYDAESPSPLSRGNILTRKETGNGIRSWTYAYEPMFNKPILVRDPLGRETTISYDYMEDSSSQNSFVMGRLRRFGLPASATLERLAPSFRFYAADLNGDGKTDQWAGNPILISQPTATLASGAMQPFATSYQYNDFGQVTLIKEPGDRTTKLAYFPANRPNGSAIEMTSLGTDYLTLEERTARHETGGYLASVSQDLIQAASAGELGKPATLELRQTFAYNAVGDLVSETDSAGKVRRHEYDGFGLLVRTVDQEGFDKSFTYDRARNLLWSYEAIGESQAGQAATRRTRRFYDRENHLVATCTELSPGACNAPAPSSSYSEPTKPRPIPDDELLELLSKRRLTDQAMVLTTYRYDAEGRLVGLTDPEGHRHGAVYNTRGLPTSVTRGAGSASSETTNYDYDADGRVVKSRNGAREETSFIYDAFGRLDLERWPNGTTVDYEYDLGGRLRSKRIKDKNGAELKYTRYEPDERDRIKEFHQRWFTPDNQLSQVGYKAELTTKLEHDPHGNPVAVTDPSSAVYRFIYDNLGRQVTETDPRGNQSFFYADPLAGRMFSRVKGEGRDVTTETVLDGRGLPITATTSGKDGLSSTSRATYDGLGNVVMRTDPQGNTSVSNYDALGRLVTSSVPEEEKGQSNLTTSYTLDRRGLVIKLVDPAGVVTSRTYSATGKATSEQAGSRQNAMSYDAAGRVMSVTRGDGTILTMTYRDGFLLSIDARKAGRLQGSRMFTRDGLGRVTWAMQAGRGASVRSELAYDSLGRLLMESTKVGDASPLKTRYAFDPIGALRTLEYPDGVRAEMNTDLLGRATSTRLGASRAYFSWRGSSLSMWSVYADDRSRIQTSLTSFDTLERPTFLSAMRLQYEPTFAEQRSLDPLGRVRLQVANWKLDGSQALRSRAVSYSGAGWVTSLAESNRAVASSPVLASNSEVESLIRGDAAMRGAAVISFQRDSVGTLLTEQKGAMSAFAGVKAQDHRYASVQLDGLNTGIQYDADGHVTTDGRSRFTWDAFDSLLSAELLGSTGSAGRSYEYTYDAFGRRVGKTEKVGTNGNAMPLVETYALAGWETIATYRRGRLHQRMLLGPLGDQPLQIEGPGETTYPYYDIQGNIVGVLVGKNARTLERYEYDAYGNVKVADNSGRVTCEEKGTTTCPMALEYGYNGQRRDPETGLYYYKNRYYSPALRSFLSMDPLGYVDSFNPWAYVGGDPINFTDPLGLSAMDRSGIGRLWDSLKEGVGSAWDGAKADVHGGLILIGHTWHGAANAFGDDMVLGLLGYQPEGTAQAIGAGLGHGAATIVGLLEMIVGGGMASGGAMIATAGNAPAPGLAAVGGVAMATVGAGITTHGLGTAGTGLGKLAEMFRTGDGSGKPGDNGSGGGKKPPKEPTASGGGKGPVHHLMTNKNAVSTARGGPWTPRFEDMAKRAGMTLEDAANKVAIPGHRGPHAQAYHTEVFDRLSRATEGLSGDAYSAAFRAELGAIRTEAATAGSALNRLLVP